MSSVEVGKVKKVGEPRRIRKPRFHGAPDREGFQASMGLEGVPVSSKLYQHAVRQPPLRGRKAKPKLCPACQAVGSRSQKAEPELILVTEMPGMPGVGVAGVIAKIFGELDLLRMKYPQKALDAAIYAVAAHASPVARASAIRAHLDGWVFPNRREDLAKAAALLNKHRDTVSKLETSGD